MTNTYQSLPPSLNSNASDRPAVAAIAPEPTVTPHGRPGAPSLIMSMPARMDLSIKVFRIVWLVVLSGSLVAVTVLLRQGGSGSVYEWWWIPCVALFVSLLVVLTSPKSCDIHSWGVNVNAKLATYSLKFDDMAAVEVVRSSSCWHGAACSFPRTHFTSFSNGIFFRSNVCGRSLSFTPLDIDQFLMALQQTAANGKIMYR